MPDFKLTAKQDEARIAVLCGAGMYVCLFGGSRSGKTFLLVRQVVLRALKAPNSRHAIFRFRFNAIKASIIMDTFPKVMALAFPGVGYALNKTDWFAEFNNGSQIWFGGLDDKERTEKILGQEFVTIYFNETSQIPYPSITMAITRLAQKVEQDADGRQLKPRCYFDLNPPTKAHWSYKLFILKQDPETKKPLSNPDDYASFQINPHDNQENLSETYLKTLEGMSPRMRQRFLAGQFADDNPNALFTYENIEANRKIKGALPELLRIVIGVDPSGASDDNEDTHNDDIGIVVGALGIDGRAYLLEDCTVMAGPSVWGRVVTAAFDRHAANMVVGETNYGGGMVEYVIKTSRPRTPFKMVTASRGKHIRAEPFSALYFEGKIAHVGYFPELEDEMLAFATTGYLGGKSPNRADAWFWVLAELFSGIVAEKKKKTPIVQPFRPSVSGMGY
jgi:phage terminase large subunit-like protein